MEFQVAADNVMGFDASQLTITAGVEVGLIIVMVSLADNPYAVTVNIAVPPPVPANHPFASTVKTFVSEEDQTALVAVMYNPDESPTVADNCNFVRLAYIPDADVKPLMEIDVGTGGGVTVTSIEPLKPACVAVIVVVPSLTGETPLLFQITPTLGSEDDHTAVLSTTSDVPSEKCKVASSHNG